MPSSLKAAWISLDNRRGRLDKRPVCPPRTAEAAQLHKAMCPFHACSWPSFSQQDCVSTPRLLLARLQPASFLGSSWGLQPGARQLTWNPAGSMGSEQAPRHRKRTTVHLSRL